MAAAIEVRDVSKRFPGSGTQTPNDASDPSVHAGAGMQCVHRDGHWAGCTSATVRDPRAGEVTYRWRRADG